MKLNDNEIIRITGNTKLSAEIKNKILLGIEKEEIIELINKEKDAFNLSGVKEILQLILNNEDAVRDIYEYTYSKYPNEYLCFPCDNWDNDCKLKKNLYDSCKQL